MRDEEKIIVILAKTLELAKETLPDSWKWKYCWDEMTSEEQKEVKRVAIEIDKALEFHKERKNEKDNNKTGR